jgi:hypothetical protein
VSMETAEHNVCDVRFGSSELTPDDANP